MNVLSLFDGMSCGRIALERLGVQVENYYASEIDKYAEIVSKANYPDIIRLGDVNKWEDWDMDWSSIDLVLAGFPCQAWSLSGKQLGAKDPRGALFWTTLDIISKVLAANPNAKFLMENVKMKKEFEEYITKHTEEALGKVNKHLINSKLVSAQNRERYYWTNIEGITQPKDRKIYLKDIIENGVVDRDKSYCIDANYFKGGNLEQYLKKSRRQLVFEPKNGLKYLGGVLNNHGFVPAGNRFYHESGKSPTLVANGGRLAGKASCIIHDDYCFRKLTPLECERLQTVDEGFTNYVSNTQRYKMLGNGWTIDVICHILKEML